MIPIHKVSIISEIAPKFTCLNCNVKFETGELQRDHFRSEWHRYNLKRKVCSLQPISLDNFNQIQSAVPKVENKAPSDKTRLTGEHNNYENNRIGDLEDHDDQDNWEDLDSDDLVDEEYDEEEVQEMLDRVIECDTCLFCNKKSSGIKSNVRHMTDFHGFFLPEDRYLVDEEGLLKYLGFKVGAGATCLWCEKQFTSVHGVRLHMMYKDHCKILYDQHKATGEFKEFYDYSSQEQFTMKPVTSLLIKKRPSERKYEQSRQLMKLNNDRQMVLKKQQSAASKVLISKSYKKFNAQRAKTIMKIGLSNNETCRGRIRLQNPM